MAGTFLFVLSNKPIPQCLPCPLILLLSSLLPQDKNSKGGSWIPQEHRTFTSGATGSWAPKAGEGAEHREESTGISSSKDGM